MGRLAWILALLLAVEPSASGIAAGTDAPPELPAVAAFTRRVQAYYALHRNLEQCLSPTRGRVVKDRIT